jgi:hypothetical protein
VFFVVYGAFSPDDRKAGNRSDAAGYSAPGWSKALGRLISSAKPKVELKKRVYSESTEETIAPDDTQTFRTATFHLIRGRASIDYEDQTEDISDDLEDLKEQECELPNSETDDPRRCSIVALKKGGKLSFSCQGTDPCRVEVE